MYRARLFLGLIALISVAISIVLPLVAYIVYAPKESWLEAFISRVPIPMRIRLWPLSIEIGSIWKQKFVTFNGTLDNIDRIHLEILGGTIEISKGIDRAIVYTYAIDREIAESYVDIDRNDHELYIDAKSSEVFIYIDKQIKELDISVYGGTIDINSIVIENLSIKLKGGTFNSEAVAIGKELDLSIKGASIDGSISLEPRSKIKLDVVGGSIDMSLHIPKDIPICIKESREIACSIDINGDYLRLCNESSIILAISCNGASVDIDIVTK